MNKSFQVWGAILLAGALASCAELGGRTGQQEQSKPCCKCCEKRIDGLFSSGGNVPMRLAADGSHIWAINMQAQAGSISSSLAKIRVENGEMVAPFPLVYGPPQQSSVRHMTVAGSYIWLGGIIGDKPLAKVRASDGHLSDADRYSPLFDRYQSIGHVQALAFDGTNIWVALNYPIPNEPGNFDRLVLKLSPSNGEVLQEYSFNDRGIGPMIFDGTYIWVTHGMNATSREGAVSRIRVSDGALSKPYPTHGNVPAALVSDGAYIWVAHRDPPPPSTEYTDFHTVSKIRASNGEFIDLYSSGGYRSVALAFDGANIWVANLEGHSIGKIRARDGKLIGTYSSGIYWPNALAFDGASIWVANSHAAMDKNIAAKCVWCCCEKFECPLTETPAAASPAY